MIGKAMDLWNSNNYKKERGFPKGDEDHKALLPPSILL